MAAPIILLLANQTANGSSQEVELPISGQQPLQGVREYHVVMSGVWDTATMVLEISIDGGTTWVVVLSKTADFQGIVELGPCLARATVSSVGASTDLHASLNG